MGKRIIIARQWRLPKVVLSFFALELCLTVAALALYGIADPNLYRTKLWLDGALNGFNSHPEQVLYAYANHEKPIIPLVWSQTITTFNLVISILSTFLLLVKSVMFVMKTWVPLLSLIMHMILTGLYIFSTYAQLSSDKSDPTRIQDGPPWYITKSCDVVHDRSNYGYCRQAKASLAVAVVMMSILFIQIILAAISVVPSELEKQMRGYYDEDSDDDYQHGEVVMYAPEKPEDLSYYSPQAPSQAHPYSPLPQKQPISYPETINNYELSDLPSKAVLESQRQSQQYPPPSFTPQPPTFTPSPPSQAPYAPPQTHTPQPPSRPQSQAQNQTQSAFAQNLMQTYLQHSPAGRAITTSEPTPPLSSSDLPPHRPSSTTKITTLPVFDPPPTGAAVAPTPRTMAFNRLTGREKTEAEKLHATKKAEERRKKLRLFSSGREGDSDGDKGAGKERLEKERKEGRKERKEREKREKEEERKRGVERYFELQRAGPPSLYGRGPQREVDWVQEGRGEWDGGMQPMYRGSSYGAQGYGQQERQQQDYGAGYAQVRGHGQSGGLPFRERYGA
ncbi:hypothetical protein B9Z65_2880 [Elsinoe australis]|uniref:Uncharacterized protein n=1 Tax=Elsinoe australis TaxID=40998 RepID=A0A2P7ZTS6_9PEZI|nr:hypothetical protein B9Z65_2880 [Elsinoe australis]